MIGVDVKRLDPRREKKNPMCDFLHRVKIGGIIFAIILSIQFIFNH